MPRKDASLRLLGWLRPVRSWVTERGKVHADDSMARFVRGRCHVCTGAGETPDIKGVSSVFDRAKEIATIGHGERKSAMMIELPEKLEAALKVQANAHGVSPAGYVCEVLARDLASSLEGQSSGVPFKTGRGMFAKYGQAPSAEEIDANRADMFRNFGEDS